MTDRVPSPATPGGADPLATAGRARVAGQRWRRWPPTSTCPGFPAMGDALDAGPSGVQLTLTAFLVGLALGQLVMGPLSDHFGRRRPLVVSATVCVAAGVVCALAPTLPVLLAGRLVQGFAGAGGMVIGRAVIADLVTGRAAAKAFTLMITVGGVAPVLAPLVGSLLADPVGWRGMLWTVAGLCVAMLLGVLLVVPETHPPEARTVHREASPLGGIRHGARHPRLPQPDRGERAVVRRADGLHLVVAVRLPERRRPLRDRVRRRVRRQRHRADRCRLGRQPAGRPVVAEAGAARRHRRPARRPPARTSCSRWPVRRPGPCRCRSSSRSRRTAGSWGTRRPWRCHWSGRWPARGAPSSGCTTFAVGALVSPLVGLGGEDSAVVPALVMAAALHPQLHARAGGPAAEEAQSRSSSSAIATS